MKPIVVLAVLLMAIGCGSADWRVPQFSTRDSYSIGDSGPLVLGNGAAPDPGRWELVTWPELSSVPSSAAAPVFAHGMPDWSMELTPEGAFEARWYALRHLGPPAEGTTLVGVTLADGGIVGRFFGVAVPEIDEIVAQVDGRITLSFTHYVVPDGERAASEVASASQDSIRCETVFLGEPGLLGDRITLQCDPRLDWSLPVQIDVEGAMSERGRPIAPFHTTHTFAEVATDGVAVLNPESALVPPPVPTALCGGVDCE